jgi:hypothetical protein
MGETVSLRLVLRVISAGYPATVPKRFALVLASSTARDLAELLAKS